MYGSRLYRNLIACLLVVLILGLMVTCSGCSSLQAGAPERAQKYPYRSVGNAVTKTTVVLNREGTLILYEEGQRSVSVPDWCKPSK